MRRVAWVVLAVGLLAVAGCLSQETEPEAQATDTDESTPTAANGSESPRGNETSNASASSAGAANATQEDPVDPPGGAEDRARTVVAVVDTGINPYHEAFHRETPSPDPETSIAGYPSNVTAIELSLDAEDYRTALANDSAELAHLEEEKLVRFEGTRIVGAISFGHYEGQGLYPILDEHGHGTGTASMVARAAPEVDIVAIQVRHAAVAAEGVQWAANRSWIDVVSVSVGTLGNVPIDRLHWEEAFGFEELRIQDASRNAVQSGKLVVFGAGNQPTSSTTDGNSGPPWVVSVGGATNASQGETLVASKNPDVVGPFRVNAAQERTMQARDNVSGTSFAAPTVAGAAAGALHEVRQATNAESSASRALVEAPEREEGALQDGALTVPELRDALNRSGVYWDAAAYEPNLGYSVPVAPTPWVQMGWGFVDGSRSTPMAEHLLGEDRLEEKPLGAQAHQQAVLEARKALWMDV